MKPFRASSTEQPQPTGAYHAPETFTGLRIKALQKFLLAVAIAVAAVALAVTTSLLWPAVFGLLAAQPIIHGILLWEYSNRLIERELPRHPKAKRTGDTWRIHLKREIPVGAAGTVNLDPDPIDLPVKPTEFVRIVRDMQRSGTSRDKRPAGVSQPLWRKIMAALEDLDGAAKGPNGYELADDLDALLEDISHW